MSAPSASVPAQDGVALTAVEKAEREVAALEAECMDLEESIWVLNWYRSPQKTEAKRTQLGDKLWDDFGLDVENVDSANETRAEQEKNVDLVYELLVLARKHRALVTEMAPQAPQKRGREPTGETPKATRVRASSASTPQPPRLSALPTSIEIEHSPDKRPQASSPPLARDLYDQLSVEDFTVDFDYDNEDPLTFGPLERVSGADARELAVQNYLSQRAFVAVRCKFTRWCKFMRWCFSGVYETHCGTQVLHSAIPDLVVFRKTAEIEATIHVLYDSICHKHGPLLIEVQSEEKSVEDAKVQLLTALYSFVNHCGKQCVVSSVYGIMVERTLELVHVVRYKDGVYASDGCFPAQCLGDLCDHLLSGV